MEAVLHKHEGAVRLLLNRGARTTVRNHWQQTAHELARHNGLEAIAGLIEARDSADTERIRASAMIAAIKAGNAGEVKRLIAAGASEDESAPVVGSLDDDTRRWAWPRATAAATSFAYCSTPAQTLAERQG